MIGDLNYRLVGQPDEIIDEVAEAALNSIRPGTMTHEYSGASQESKANIETAVESLTVESTWLTERYSSLEVGRHSKPCSAMWHKLLMRHDELLAVAHKSGQVLHGFHEGPIGFPPTYRRVRGIEGDCWDYTDPDRLRKCYTTRLGGSPTTSVVAGEDDDDEESQRNFKGVKVRVPSYTDRIW